MQRVIVLLLIYLPRKDERLSWPSWMTQSGRFTRIVVTRRLTSVYVYVTRFLAVAKRPCDCCVGQFWPNATGRRYFADVMGLSSTRSTTVTYSACKAIEFGEITQNKGYYAVQGHSRSPISVPIESLYATLVTYWWTLIINKTRSVWPSYNWVCRSSQGRIYSQQGLVQKKCGGPSTQAADPIFPEKNWRPYLVITVCQLSLLLKN